MKFAALGRTRWLYDAIRCCVEHGHDLRLIGTCPAAPEYDVLPEHFESLARESGCPYFCDTTLHRPQYLALIAESEAEIAISVNWLTIIGEEVIDRFPHGVINAHAGDLPRYRGNACPNWAIIAGEEFVVVTLHQMTPELDAGPVLLQRRFPLDRETYIGDVYDFMDRNIPDMFATVLDGLENGSIEPHPQRVEEVTPLRCYPRRPEDSVLCWSEPAEHLARVVRASAEPFSGAFTYLEGERLTVWRAHPERVLYDVLGIPGQVTERRPTSGEVAVLTGKGFLVLEEVETERLGRVPASEVIRSTRARLGLNTTAELLRLSDPVQTLQKRIAALEAGSHPQQGKEPGEESA